MTTIDAWTYRSSIVAQDIIGYDVEAVDGDATVVPARR